MELLTPSFCHFYHAGCSSHRGHLSHCCCWWVQLRTQIVRPNREGTHVSLKQLCSNKHTGSTYVHPKTYMGPRTQSFIVLSGICGHPPTSVWLSTAEEEMADHHGNPCVPFCYSCDVCGDTFDPVVNFGLQGLCRVQRDAGSTAVSTSDWGSWAFKRKYLGCCRKITADQEPVTEKKEVSARVLINTRLLLLLKDLVFYGLNVSLLVSLKCWGCSALLTSL